MNEVLIKLQLKSTGCMLLEFSVPNCTCQYFARDSGRKGRQELLYRKKMTHTYAV